MKSAAHRTQLPYLAIVVAGLAYLNWWQASTPIDVSPLHSEPPAEIAAVANEPSEPDAGVVHALADFTETVNRPLFRADRRPPAAPAAAQPGPAVQETAASTPADTMRVVGMMRSGTSARRALIRIAGLPGATWVETGGEIGGWTVDAIEADRVAIERNGERAELKLFGAKPAPPAAP